MAPSAQALSFSFTNFDVPGASETWRIDDINDNGQFVGSYSDSNSVQHGFISSGGVLTAIDAPGANLTVATGINNNAQVVGYYNSAGGTYGYSCNGGFTILNAPAQLATGINESGQIVGAYYYNHPFATGQHAFVEHNGIVTSFDVPGAIATFAHRITNAGQMLGWYSNDGVTDHGFIDNGGVFTTLDVPGATSGQSHEGTA